MCHGRRSPRRRGRPEPAPLLQHSMIVQCRERASADKGAKVIVRSSLRRGGRARARGQGWAVARQGECEQGPRQRTHHTVAGGYLMTAIGSAPERSAPRHTRSRSPARKMQTNFKQSIPGGSVRAASNPRGLAFPGTLQRVLLRLFQHLAGVGSFAGVQLFPRDRLPERQSLKHLRWFERCEDEGSSS